MVRNSLIIITGVMMSIIFINLGIWLSEQTTNWKTFVREANSEGSSVYFYCSERHNEVKQKYGASCDELHRNYGLTNIIVTHLSIILVVCFLVVFFTRSHRYMIATNILIPSLLYNLNNPPLFAYGLIDFFFALITVPSVFGLLFVIFRLKPPQKQN